MSKRFLSAKTGALKLLKRKPALRFEGRTRAQWLAWRRRFQASLIRLMGPVPEPAPLRVKRVERVRCAGYTREKILFNPDSFSTISAYVLIPDGIRRGERRPAVLCAHGHGEGKDELLGLVRVKHVESADPYKDMAAKLARDGFVVIAPDWRSFGERRDAADYIGHWKGEHGADGCDLSYMLYGYFGYQLLTLDVADARRCVDYLLSRKDVDPRRIGAIGCSFGGTMTMYAAALDRRIKAAVISSYLSTLGDAIGDRGRGNICGSQFLFGLRTIGDIADVAGLIAPRPCMVQIGRHDQCFIESDALRAFKHLRRIYRTAGAAKQLELDHFEGSHEFDPPAAIDFLRRRLRPNRPTD